MEKWQCFLYFEDFRLKLGTFIERMIYAKLCVYFRNIFGIIWEIL